MDNNQQNNSIRSSKFINRQYFQKQQQQLPHELPYQQQQQQQCSQLSTKYSKPISNLSWYESSSQSSKKSSSSSTSLSSLSKCNKNPLIGYPPKKTITKKDLQNRYHLNKNLACYSIGISESEMNKYYKLGNINRWPYRKLNSINTVIKYHKDELKNKGLQLNDEQKLIIENEIANLKLLRNDFINNPSQYNTMLDIKKCISIVKII
jgi:hypothetical protein